MKFTYNAYKDMLKLIGKSGYEITDYHNYYKYDKCVILRHDVDMDMSKALTMSQIEYEHGITSTYFVLLTSNFYNLFSQKNVKIMRRIMEQGHTVGLHFDEVAYPAAMGKPDMISEYIEKEMKMLSEILETEVTAFSYHRPTREILDAEIEINTGGGYKCINTYKPLFFKDFKYLSDSRMHWREPVLENIKEQRFQRMQILTHPFWYSETEQTMKDILMKFICSANSERYNCANDNFTSLSEVLAEEDINTYCMGGGIGK